jgi:hypothetical protein
MSVPLLFLVLCGLAFVFLAATLDAVNKKRRAQNPAEDSNFDPVEFVLSSCKGVPGQERLLDELHDITEHFDTLKARVEQIERAGRLTDYSTMEEIDDEINKRISYLHTLLEITRRISKLVPSIIKVFENFEQLQEYRYKFQTRVKQQKRDERERADQELYAIATIEVKEELDMRRRVSNRIKEIFPERVPLKYGGSRYSRFLYQSVNTSLSKNTQEMTIYYPRVIKEHCRAIRNRRLLRAAIRNAVLFIFCIIIFMVGAC